MKTTLQFQDLKIHNSWHRLLEENLEHWARLTAVTAAEVIMDRQREGRPAFRVQVRLETSGGRLHAEGIAPSLKAALLKVSEDLEAQIRARKARRLEPGAGAAGSTPSPSHGPGIEPVTGLERIGTPDRGTTRTPSLV